MECFARRTEALVTLTLDSTKLQQIHRMFLTSPIPWTAHGIDRSIEVGGPIAELDQPARILTALYEPKPLRWPGRGQHRDAGPKDDRDEGDNVLRDRSGPAEGSRQLRSPDQPCPHQSSEAKLGYDLIGAGIRQDQVRPRYFKIATGEDPAWFSWIRPGPEGEALLVGPASKKHRVDGCVELRVAVVLIRILKRRQPRDATVRGCDVAVQAGGEVVYDFDHAVTPMPGPPATPYSCPSQRNGKTCLWSIGV